MARILVADDDNASLDVLVIALQAEGHEVLCASNGQEAYELAAAEKPDLVFLDVMMPVQDGYEACSMMRSDTTLPRDLPIVFLTSLEPDSKTLERVGASGYLPKRHMVVQLRDLLLKYLGPDAIGPGTP